MRRILIVEDDKLLASQIREILEFQGFEAEVAFTGPDGITAFANEPADLLIVAVMLPGVHGIRVLERIRELPGGAHVPAFLMCAVYRTAKMFAADMERLGVVAFLAKPFSLNELAGRIEKLLLGIDSGYFQAVSDPDLDPLPAAPPTPSPDLLTPPGGSDAVSDPWASGPDSWPDAPEDSFLPVDTGRHLPSGGELTAERWVQAVTTLFHSHSSGRLRLETEAGPRILYFLNGYPVWVQVDGDGPGLAHWLVDEQILVDSDLDRIADAVKADGWSTRKALLELGLVAASDLPPLIEGWVASEVQRGLSPSGRFVFEPSDDFAARIPVYEVNPIRVLWDGLGRTLSKEDAEREVESWAGTWVGKTSTFARLFGYLSGSGMADLSVFLETKRSLREVRTRYDDSRGNVSRCIWMMRHAGLIGFTAAPPTAPSRPRNLAPKPAAKRAPETPEPPSVQTHRYTAADVERLRKAGGAARAAAGSKQLEEDIIKDYLTKIDEDHYTFLGVTRLATPSEIANAYDALAARYRTAGTSIQGDARRKAKELLAHLVGAFEELRDADRRALYDQALRRRMLGIETPVDPFLDEEISGFEIPSVSEIWEGDVDQTDTVSGAQYFDDTTGYPPIMSEGRLDQVAARLGPKHGPLWSQARRQMLAGEWRRAYLALDAIREDLPDDPTVLSDLGWCRFVLADGDYDAIAAGLEWTELALTFSPRHLGAAEVKARILCRSRSDASNEDQVRALERLLRLNPGLPWAEVQLSRRRRPDSTLDDKDRSSGLRGLFRRKK